MAETAAGVNKTAEERFASTTVGAAIQVLESKLARKGLNLLRELDDRGKLLLLSNLVGLTIDHAIYVEDLDEDSVAYLVEESESKEDYKTLLPKSLSPGNVVALCREDELLSMDKYGQISFLPNTLINSKEDTFRFLVVNAGHGGIAFLGISCRRFLTKTMTSGLTIWKLDQSPKALETFYLEKDDLGDFYALTEDLNVIQFRGFEL